MKRHLLDTSIISNVIKPEPSPPLLSWLEAQADDALFIASLTLAEIRRGVLAKGAGRKRDALDRWFSGPEGPHALFAGRILAFDELAALIWAKLMADGKAAGRPRNPLDMIIASIAVANDCIVVTDNERDYGDVEFINPMGASPQL